MLFEKDYYEMKFLRKKFWKLNPYLLSLMFGIVSLIPTHASVQKEVALIAAGNISEAITRLTSLATQKNVQALYLLAIIYLSPTSNYFNAQKGIDLLKKAAFLNYPPALDELAGLYLGGEGVEKNETKALNYYTQAAHMGYGPSQFNCGIMYKNGQGISKDLMKSYLYLSLASLNDQDLQDVALDAAQYRDEVALLLSPLERQEALRQVNSITISNHSLKRQYS